MKRNVIARVHSERTRAFDWRPPVIAFLKNEPVMVLMGVRAVLYILGAVAGIRLEPEMGEAIVGILFGLLGIDAATSAAARAKVSPVGKLPG